MARRCGGLHVPIAVGKIRVPTFLEKLRGFMSVVVLEYPARAVGVHVNLPSRFARVLGFVLRGTGVV